VKGTALGCPTARRSGQFDRNTIGLKKRLRFMREAVPV
jgi:hypothetical protein